MSLLRILYVDRYVCGSVTKIPSDQIPGDKIPSYKIPSDYKNPKGRKFLNV